AVAGVSLVAAVSVFLIRSADLHEAHVAGHARPHVDGLHVLRDRRAVVLLSATALFHLANAPVMPLVALYVTRLHGTHTQVPAVVLVAQQVMFPVAWLAGRSCDTWGRRPTFLIGFLALPLRIFLYSLTRDARALVALQALDGLGAGIYGVAVIAVCADV